MAATTTTLPSSSPMSNVETRCRVDSMVTVGSMTLLRGSGVSLLTQVASLRGPGEAAVRQFATLFTRPAGYVASGARPCPELRPWALHSRRLGCDGRCTRDRRD